MRDEFDRMSRRFERRFGRYGTRDCGGDCLWDEFDEVRVRRLPNPGIAAVLAVLVPGLGHVYIGRLAAAALWFAAITFGYWAILVPGLLLHAISVFTAYRSAEDAEG